MFKRECQVCKVQEARIPELKENYERRLEEVQKLLSQALKDAAELREMMTKQTKLNPFDVFKMFDEVKDVKSEEI